MHATYIYSPKDNKYLEVVNSDRFGELFNVHIEVIGENKYNISFFHGDSLDKLPKWFTWWLEYTESGINCDAMLTAINNFREYIRHVTGECNHAMCLPEIVTHDTRPLAASEAETLKANLLLCIELVIAVAYAEELFNNEICAYKDDVSDATDKLYSVLEMMFDLKVSMTGNVVYICNVTNTDTQTVMHELKHTEICCPIYN